LLVPEAAERFQQGEGRLQLRDVHLAPLPDVAKRRRPERGEVAPNHFGPCLERNERLGLVEEDEPPGRSRLPESGLVVMHEVRTSAGRAPRTSGADPADAVLSLEVRDRIRGDDGPVGSVLPDGWSQLFGACR